MKTHSIAARDMVEHKTIIDGSTRVCDLLAWFKANPKIQYVAVLNAGRLAGIVGRDQLNARLADKYGYSVLANRPVTAIMNPAPVMVHGNMEVHEISRSLLQLSVDDSTFYQDILVLEPDGQFAGLASIKRLLFTQMNQNIEQMATLERQASELAQKNEELVAVNLRRQDEGAEFRMFFETCSVPLLMLDGQNRLVQANHKFIELLGYNSDDIKPGLPDTALIEGGVERFKNVHLEARRHFDEDKSRYFIVFHHANGKDLGVETALDFNAGRQRMVLSLLRVATQHELDLHLKMLKEAEAKGEKAQSLVNTLIDRNSNTIFMMRKMENMFDMADRLDSPDSDKTDSLTGSIANFSVTDLAQLLIYGGKTGQLNVTSGLLEGAVFFEHGKIVHAEIGGQTGEAALLEIISISNGDFNFNYLVTTSKRTVHGDPTGILIRLCSKRDESIGEFA